MRDRCRAATVATAPSAGRGRRHAARRRPWRDRERPLGARRLRVAPSTRRRRPCSAGARCRRVASQLVPPPRDRKNSRNSSMPSAASSGGRRCSTPSGVLGVDAVHCRLVGHPPGRPRRRRAAVSTTTLVSPGRCRRARGTARRRARWRTWRRRRTLRRRVAGTGSLRVDVVLGMQGLLANDPAPEVVDLTDVPDEIGRRPLRAPRHGRQRIGAAGRRQQGGRLVVQRGQEAGAVHRA